jgi:hypothetical protein
MPHGIAQHSDILAVARAKQHENFLCPAVHSHQREKVRLKEDSRSHGHQSLDLLSDKIAARVAKTLNKRRVHICDASIVAEGNDSAWYAVEQVAEIRGHSCIAEVAN